MKRVFYPTLLLLYLGCTSSASAQQPAPNERKASSDLTDEAEAESDADTKNSSPVAAEKSEGQKSANQEADARAAFREGDRLYYEGDYKGAVQSFERAYAMSGRIEMLFNLANAHERLRDYTKASVALRGYIPHASRDDRPSLERRLERLEKLAEEEKSSLKAPPAHEAAAVPGERGVPFDRALGYGLTTLGGAAVITGVALAISAGTARKQLNELCVEGNSGRLCPEEAEIYVKRDRAHSIAADISLIAGAALAATGVYLVVRKKDKREIRAAAGPGTLLIWGNF